VLFVALSILTRRHQCFAESAVAWGFFGWLGFLICLYLLTFPGLMDDLLGWRGKTSKNFTLARLVYSWLPFAVALVARGGVGWPFRPGTTRERRQRDRGRRGTLCRARGKAVSLRSRGVGSQWRDWRRATQTRDCLRGAPSSRSVKTKPMSEMAPGHRRQSWRFMGKMNFDSFHASD
jgi:hypothetical protein